VPIKLYSRERLEVIAEEFLRDWGQYDHFSLRIEQSIENFGYEIVPVPGMAEIAEAYIAAQGKRIYIDEAQYLNVSCRGRFTLSEELAHILIHRPMFDGMSPDQIKDFQRGITNKEYLSMEWQAKRLAGAILMRRDKYKMRFEHHIRRLSELNASGTVSLKSIVRQLHMDFFVSSYSVAMRALDLRLIDRAQLNDLCESFGWGQ
jgi:Zn-dependent peptidase ImmA (M78 family)